MEERGEIRRRERGDTEGGRGGGRHGGRDGGRDGGRQVQRTRRSRLIREQLHEGRVFALRDRERVTKEREGGGMRHFLGRELHYGKMDRAVGRKEVKGASD